MSIFRQIRIKMKIVGFCYKFVVINLHSRVNYNNNWMVLNFFGDFIMAIQKI